MAGEPRPGTEGLDPLIIGLVAASALLHVAWNVRLKTAGDPAADRHDRDVGRILRDRPALARAWLASGSPALSPEGIALGLASGVFEAAYFILLAAAYRRGDLSVVYPLARGTAPLLLVAVGVVPRRTSRRGLGGRRVSARGLPRPSAAVAGAPGPGGRSPAGCRDRLRDRDGRDDRLLHLVGSPRDPRDRPVHLRVDPVGVGAILLVIWVGGWSPGGDCGPGGPAQNRRAAEGGFITLAAYLLILLALSVAPLTAVAPLRESATVIVATWGAVRLGEAASRGDATRRIGASAVIVLGALLLALDG